MTVALTVTVHSKLDCDEDLKKEIFASDQFTDKWGYTINWTDLNDGWNEEKREQLMELQVKNEVQPTIGKTLSNKISRKM